MDPIITPIAIVLAKYALDKGAELVKEVGPKALETAKEMFAVALDRLRRDPKGGVIAGEFEKAPDVYEKPMQQVLAEAVEADSDFAAQLKALLEQYEKAVEEHVATTGTTYQATVEGSGAIAQEGSVAAGAGGVAAGGDIHGGVHISRRREEENK